MKSIARIFALLARFAPSPAAAAAQRYNVLLIMKSVPGAREVSLGAAPADAGEDWLILARK